MKKGSIASNAIETLSRSNGVGDLLARTVPRDRGKGLPGKGAERVFELHLMSDIPLRIELKLELASGQARITESYTARGTREDG